MISTIPQAICFLGKVNVNSGFIIAKHGRFSWEPKPFFSPVSSLVKTAESLISLPAAEIVNITPTGILFFNTSFPTQKSHKSIVGFATPCAIALAVSMTLPPPTAKIKSILFSTAVFTPSLAKLRRGLGCTPPNKI